MLLENLAKNLPQIEVDTTPPSVPEGAGLPALQGAWVEFLQRWEWDWFCTFTFRGDYIHPEAADKRFRVLMSEANRELHGRRWKEKGLGVQWVRALEYQRRGVIHFHALVRQVGALRRLSFMDRWDELAGYSRIEPVRRSHAVRRYVSKYVTKGGELDVGGIWADALNGPQLPFPPSRSGQVCGPEPDEGHTAVYAGGSQRVGRGRQRHHQPAGAPPVKPLRDAWSQRVGARGAVAS